MQPLFDYVRDNPVEVAAIVTAIVLALTGKWRDAIAYLFSVFRPASEPALFADVAPAQVAYLDHLLAEYKTQLLSHDHAAADVTHAKIQALCDHGHPVRVESIKP